MYKHELNYLIETAIILKSKDVLDIGCGEFFLDLLKYKKNTYGIEVGRD